MPTIPYIYALIASFFCLFVAAGASAKPTPSPISPFAATGLLTRPDERAEDLVLRAHRQDAKAMALVATGYAQGIGGFPKDRTLAAAWGKRLAYLGDMETMDLVALQLWPADTSLHADLGVRLANCDNARESQLAPPFKKAGIVDIDVLCGALEKRKSQSPGWEKSYQQGRMGVQAIKQLLRSAMTTMRALRARPATPKEYEILREIMDIVPVDVLLLFAATTHDPDKAPPDWNAQRLLSLVGAQRTAAKELFAMLVSHVPETIANHVDDNTAQTASLVHTAHAVNADFTAAEETQAFRSMARHYREGTLGFVKDPSLARGWLRYAALENDYDSMLQLSVDLFAEGDFATSWAWAWAVHEAERASLQTKSLAETMVKLAEAAGGNDIRGQGLPLALKHLEERNERLEWRIRMREGNPKAPEQTSRIVLEHAQGI